MSLPAFLKEFRKRLCGRMGPLTKKVWEILQTPSLYTIYYDMLQCMGTY